MCSKYYLMLVFIGVSYCDARSPASLRRLCALAVPGSVAVGNGSWPGRGPPVEDPLDTFVLEQTGCEYEGVEYARGFYPREMTYDGRFSWAGAARARDELLVQVRWWPLNSTDVTYNFFVGEEDNNITEMYEYDTPNTWRKHTPMILDMNSYVPFYLTIQDGILQFGKVCDGEPLFTRDVSAAIARGDRPAIFCHSWSYVGAKFLYNCPDHV